MKFSKRKLAVLGLIAALAAPVRGLWAEEAPAGKSDESIRIEALEEAIEGLTKKTDELSMMYIEGFADTRFDDDRRPNQNTGLSGIFIRRAEIKMNGNLMEFKNMVWSLGYDFTENKMKDVGVEVKDIGLIPMLDIAPEFTWSLRVGQYRMPFGIGPQTSSSSILFTERPMAWGGKGNAGTQVAATTMVKERVMGFQLRQQKKFEGIFGYDLQIGGVNQMSDDQSAGINKIQVGAAPATGNATAQVDNFKGQVTDNDLTWIGRFAFTWDFLNSIMPEKSKLQTGISYAHDGRNSAWMAQSNSSILYDEFVGAEFLEEIANKMVTLQAEYVHQIVGVNAANGANTFREGWYGEGALDLLPWLCSSIEKGDALQVLFRLEDQTNYAVNTGAFTHKASRIGTGLKWSYSGGKNHTALNYFITAPDQMFGGDGRAALDGGTGIMSPESLIVIQQQFAFETGKPK